MLSYIFETFKIAEIDYICQFDIKGMDTNFYQRKFINNKWLAFQDWFCIYDQLEFLGFKNLLIQNIHVTCMVSNNIQLEVECAELDEYYREFLIAKDLNPNSKFLKISITKLNYNEVVENNVQLKERIRILEEMQNDATVQNEYDPIETPSIRNEYVPGSTTPYSTSSVDISSSRTTWSMTTEEIDFGSERSEMSDTNLEPNTKNLKIRKNQQRKRKNSDNLERYMCNDTETNNNESAEVKEEPVEDSEIENKTGNKNIKDYSGIQRLNISNAVGGLNEILMNKWKRQRESQLLNLKHLKIENILATFKLFKPILDKFRDEFKKCGALKKMKYTPDSPLSIMNLIDINTGIQMNQCLNNYYKRSSKCNFPKGLFYKFMLPEWILQIYMKETNLNRDRAIAQLTQRTF